MPDGIFSDQSCNLGKFGRALQWKMLVYFMNIWSILRPFDKFYGYLVYFVVNWYIYPVLVSFTKKNLATQCRTSFSDLRFFLCVFIHFSLELLLAIDVCRSRK
jgi:hypothetical protein